MHAIVRHSKQVVASHLPALTRAAATAGASTAAASSSSKPALEKEFLVYRWDPEDGKSPEYQSYKVDLNS